MIYLESYMEEGKKVKHLYMPDGSVNPELIKKKILIWGCGNDGKKLYNILKDLNVNVEYFLDSNSDLVGKSVYGIPIVSIEQLSSLQEYNLALAFYRWPDVIGRIPKQIQHNVYADYFYEHTIECKCILCEEYKCTYDKAHFAPFLKERMLMNKNTATKIIHCQYCGLHFSEYRPNESEIGRLYSGYRDEMYVEQRKRYEPDYSNGKYHGKEDKRKERLINFARTYVDFEKVNNVLDYGGDKGQFIPEEFIHAHKYVYDISGNGTVSGVMLLNKVSEMKQIKWDFVMCMQLLEHVVNPKEILTDIVEIMADKAFLYIELPRESNIYQYSDVEINEHINFFTESTMSVIAELFHLAIIRIETENLGKGQIIKALYQKYEERSKQ